MTVVSFSFWAATLAMSKAERKELVGVLRIRLNVGGPRLDHNKKLVACSALVLELATTKMKFAANPQDFQMLSGLTLV